jgi:hypothetical protein
MAATLIGVALMYAGLGTFGLGAISLLKPLAFLGIRTRLAGLIVMAVGVKECRPYGTPENLEHACSRHSRGGL